MRTSWDSRRPELDGFRAVAVLLVVAGHALDRVTEPGWLAQLLRATAGNAELGVRMFFVLSGFLITLLLLQEKEATGHVSFPGFYRRRARRILPAFLAYMGVIVLLAALDRIQFDWRQFAAALTFTWNYQNLWMSVHAPDGVWYFGHLWTLALEQQFYLIWPVVVAALAWHGQLRLTLAVVVLLPILRVVSYFLWPGTRGYLGGYFHSGIDSIVWGSLLALLWRAEPDRLVRQLHRRGVGMAVAIGLLVVSPMLTWRFGGAWTLPFGWSFDAALSAALIVAVMQPGALQRVFSHPWLVAIGAASYSIYLWQQLFLTPDWAAGWHLPIPLAVGLALATGFASRRWIELPFLHKGSGRARAVREAA